MIGEHGGTLLPFHRPSKLQVQVMTIEDVIPQHQGTGTASDEIAADDESLRQPVGAWLNGIVQVEPPVAAITQQLLEAGRILRGGDDEDVAYSREHERAQGIIDHGLVVDRQ